MSENIKSGLIAFDTKDALEMKYAETIALATTSITGGCIIDAMRVAILTARQLSKYVPNIYRGGYVIPEFGYSTERIGKYVSSKEAGIPDLVA